ncbi:MAG: hypothetical protein IID37_16620 [Planctomycetes bacterium]|nr:hypothetical protein [Planctomycetota bacterium]
MGKPPVAPGEPVGTLRVMKDSFEPGIVRQIEVVVTEDMCPAFDGIVVHRVYSTWSMVHHMELAARRVLVDYLEEDEEGIGTRIAVDHRSPAAVGTRVRVRAELTERTDRRVVCELEAYDGTRLLARGRQIQIVMNKQRLKAHIER